MPFGASKAAILGASGGGVSYDPAYTWISDAITTDSSTQTITFSCLPTTYDALHVIGNYGFTASHYLEVQMGSSVSNHLASGYELGADGSGGPYGANYNQSTRIFLGGYGCNTNIANGIGGNFVELLFPGYTNTDKSVGGYAYCSYPSASGWASNMGFEGVISPNSTSFHEISIRTSSGYFYSDSVFSLYGVGTATDG